jgi:hypothetical protein
MGRCIIRRVANALLHCWLIGQSFVWICSWTAGPGFIIVATNMPRG